MSEAPETQGTNSRMSRVQQEELLDSRLNNRDEREAPKQVQETDQGFRVMDNALDQNQMCFLYTSLITHLVF